MNDGNLTSRKRKLVFFHILTLLFVCFIVYTSLEIAVRTFDLPDPRLIRTIERELASADRDQAYFDRKQPIYGWDHGGPIDLSSDLTSSQSDTAYTVLFMGDSVTLGHTVDIHKEAYPVLLFKALANNMNVRVLNTAVKGFGVDQMLLKLEEVVPKYRPNLIVVAYIPHDLWRSGTNIYSGYPKPILVADESKKWKVIPAPNVRGFYKDYSNAKRRFYLCLWALSHLANNRRYYFPWFYKEYYQSLFQEIRNRLIVLTELYDVNILVVRLAHTWPSTQVPFLDRVAQDIFAGPADRKRFYYFDSEGCVRAKSVALGIDYAEEFKFHPTPIGHKIYADCLVDPLRAALFAAP